MYAVIPSLTFVHFLCWSFLAPFDFLFFYLRIIRTTGRSEGKNLSNIRLEIKYIILGIDHLALSYIWNDTNYNKFVEILKRKFFQRNQTA
jgi:hypothetical protein